MTRRLFVCCDGTWNSDSDEFQGVPVPSNVVRFFNALSERDEEGIEQLRYYHVGVGANEGRYRRMVAGAFGTGLSRDIRSAYKWLSDHYDDTSEIFVIGFSRGAFTARSLVGMLRRCGLPRSATWALVKEAWRTYRLDPQKKTTEEQQRDFRAKHGASPSIRFLGVWDTVGALGIPENVDLFGFWKNRFRFHDTNLSPDVKRAVQALAIDEQRNSFFPTLWTSCDGNDQQRVSQVWFPGVHADIGGGYKETGLSDVTLKWMISEAAVCGASFDGNMTQQVEDAGPNSMSSVHGVLHNSLTSLYQRIGYRPRSFPLLKRGSRRGSESVSDLALARQDNPPISQAPYRPNVSVAKGIEVRVFARPLWNWTGIYMTEGSRYLFNVSAGQTWVDWRTRSGAAGTAGSWVQRLVSWSKRVKDANWFELCGAIAYSAQPSVGGVPPALFYFRIGSGVEMLAPASGYLYCFANDAQWAYGNNSGSIRVEVTALDAAPSAEVDGITRRDDDLTASPTSPSGTGTSRP
ncbi:UNVERIFIED_ORG: uncharacterized protein (DUF2235 family) [Burkholderia sp. CF145]